MNQGHELQNVGNNYNNVNQQVRNNEQQIRYLTFQPYLEAPRIQGIQGHPETDGGHFG
jgi:hypothetical protein